MHEAAQKGHVDTIKLLADLGGNMNAADILGRTAIYFAVSEGHADAISTLVALKAAVNIQCEGAGVTPVHVAAEEGHEEAIIVLASAAGRIDQFSNS